MRDSEIILEIEKVRSINNRQWMELLQIAMKYSPEKTKKVLEEINKNDKKISELIEKLTIH